MPALNTQVSASKSGDHSGIWFSRKKSLIAGVVALLVFVTVLLAARWPFRQSAIVTALEEAGGGKVEIGSFRQIYFPSPGFVADHLTYRLSPDTRLATVDRLTIQSNLLGLLTRHISLIRADGMHVFVPPSGARTKFEGLNPGSTGIDTIEIRDSNLDVPRKEGGKPPLVFGIHLVTLHQVALSGSIHFSAKFSNPEPPGEITASGQFGPWKGVETPVSGDYTFENADLGEFEGIAGILSSQGKFSGVLKHIDVGGKIEIPEFEVKRSKHPVALNSEFKAYVNGVNGDTFLDRVNSQFSKTTVISEGKIVGMPGQRGKVATIDLEAHKGRIEDVLRLFAKEAQSPMAGEVSFKGRALLPPGKDRFLKKIELEGDFGISDSNFTHPGTQEKVNQLSQNAQTDTREKIEKEEKSSKGNRTKEKQDDADHWASPVLSDLRGHVVLKNGTATFSNLSFYIPGAHAQMHGTYNLINEKIDLHGTLKLDSDLSDTAHGAKAVVLKILDPFFKKKRGGSDVPVKVGGDYHNPSFGMDAGGASKRIFSGKK